MLTETLGFSLFLLFTSVIYLIVNIETGKDGLMRLKKWDKHKCICCPTTLQEKAYLFSTVLLYTNCSLFINYNKQESLLTSWLLRECMKCRPRGLLMYKVNWKFIKNMFELYFRNLLNNWSVNYKSWSCFDCMMDNQGKIVQNLKICIRIQIK